MSYFRLEHYLPPRVMEKLDLSYIKEELPKLHNTYAGASEKETELEFLKVSTQDYSDKLCICFKVSKMPINNTMNYLILFIPD